MKFKQVIALLPLVLMLVLAAAPPSRAAQQKPETKQKADRQASAKHEAPDAAEADRITVEELKAKIEKNEPVTVIDVRSEGSYESSDKKIKGSIRMLTDDIESRVKEIPRDTLVVTYCT